MKLFSRQRGLSLIELMIGILLSSMLLLGVLQVFQSNTSASRTQTAFSRVQESGRFAIDLLSKKIRAADYWGCAPDQNSIVNHLVNPTGVFDSIGADGVQGINDAASETIGSKAVKAGTDVLILSGTVDACAGGGRMVAPAVATPGSPVVRGDCPVVAGDIVLLANCKAGDVVAVSSISGETSRTITQGSTLQEVYGADSKILKPYRTKYFISASQAGENSLFVNDESGNTQELVPGIEDMQVSYGRDTSGDGVVNIWQSAENNLVNMEQVTAIKLELLVASEAGAAVGAQTVTRLDGTQSNYNDGRLRKLYVATVKVRNRGSM
ncbi:PilW family protein [Microbulbifer aggregans]|uniref:PilW family protein n=1 Tax=Microbulbifer aggregans TaxID=1769779 RepID=UPI001CFC58BC|nr:PilW family protein [Microbulbifer aggregans]